MGFIFYSFEVLISTIELQSMSPIGPLVVKIDDIIHLVTQISVNSSQIRLDHGVPIEKLIWLKCEWLENLMSSIFITNGPIGLILCSSTVLMSTSKL